MFNYPVEKNIIRFYKYKLAGLESRPIVIEAYNKLEARQKLMYIIQKHPQLNGRAVLAESLCLPIFGETVKKIDGIEHVWVGNVLEVDWIPLNEFEKLGYE